MHRQNFRVPLLIFLADLSLTLGALWLAEYLRFTLPFGRELGEGQVDLFPTIYLMVMAIWGISLYLNVYETGRWTINRWEAEVYALTTAILVSTLLLAGLLYLSFRDISRLLFIYFFLLDAVVLIAFHTCLRMIPMLRDKSTYRSRVLIIGLNTIGRSIAQDLEQTRGRHFTIIGFLDDIPPSPEDQGRNTYLGVADVVLRFAEQEMVDEIIFALPLAAQDQLTRLAIELQRYPVRVWVVPDYLDIAFMRTRVLELGGLPLIGLREPAIDGRDRFLKRILDVAIASIGLVLISPLLALISLLVKLDSPGPVLLRQTRVGENCKPFPMYKFRSMYTNADEIGQQMQSTFGNGQVIHKRKDDPRVTRVGRFIRRTSLDELPQLINVLKGEMSLVGPRPELPWLVEQYASWQRKRFAVPPGMTGWWQINGRSERLMHLHTEDDLYYIQNYSLLLDIKILIKTISVVIRGHGAY
ncbi:MAG: sugar transferase [Chloroflexi bacterium]|nr:sugar transferase [Chloroflexota bacterium]